MSRNLHSEAAHPILGSALLRSSKAQEERRPSPASCGSAAIDEQVLCGGFRYGEIVSLSGASGMGENLIIYHAIASHLLARPEREAAYVDTNGSFSAPLLRDVLGFRLKAQHEQTRLNHKGYMYGKYVDQNTSTNGQEFLNQALGLLDHVRVMRVFDITGLIEAVGEVSETMTRSGSKEKPKAPAEARRRPRSREVSDSEADEEDVDIVEDKPQSDTVSGNEADSERTLNPRKIDMLVICTLTNVVSAMVSKSATQGQAMLASFMRSLRHLTAHFQVCTIVINAAAGSDKGFGPNSKDRPDENASVFASTLGRPALGLAFTHMIDISIFLSQVPKTRTDAAAVYGAAVRSRPTNNAFIIEVSKDRYGTREGRWAPFEVVSNVKLVPSFR